MAPMVKNKARVVANMKSVPHNYERWDIQEIKVP
jgi:hypothetical protein